MAVHNNSLCKPSRGFSATALLLAISIYLTFKNIMKYRLGVIQGHWKWHHLIYRIRLPIGVPHYGPIFTIAETKRDIASFILPPAFDDMPIVTPSEFRHKILYWKLSRKRRNTFCRTRSLSNATFSFFDHVTFIQFKICCYVQNFTKIGRFFTEIWRYIDFQNGDRLPSWNCFTTIRDHPRSLCYWPQLPVKFHVNVIHRSEDIAIWTVRIFGLKFLFRPPKWGFWGTLDP